MKATNKIQALLLVILLANLISTGIHYWDNYVNFVRYPLPGWITQPGVYLAWFGLLPFGILGYWLYSRCKWWLAYGCLGLYALTGTTTLGHYFYAPIDHFSTQMNISMLSDGVVGYSLIAFIIWSALVRREWQSRLDSNNL